MGASMLGVRANAVPVLIWLIGFVPDLTQALLPREAIMTYILSTADKDPCLKLNNASEQVERDAADKECERAFLELERLNMEGYECEGGYLPKCRFLTKHDTQKNCAVLMKVRLVDVLVGCFTEALKTLGFCSNIIRLQESQAARNRQARIDKRKRKRSAGSASTETPKEEPKDTASRSSLESFPSCSSTRTRKSRRKPKPKTPTRPAWLPPKPPGKT